MTRVVVAAGRDHRHRTAVLDAVGIRVHTLVQLRGSTQRERPEKRYGDPNRDKRASVIC